jgi:hypothetical protein
MSIVSVSSATFLADTIILLRDKLKSNITSVSNRVYTSYPKNNVIYPLISVTDRGIIQPSRLGMASEGTIITIDVEIRVWARNVKERDEITQEIYNYLRTNQLDTTTGLSESGLHDFSLMSAVNVDEDGEQGIKSKVMEVRFIILCS